MKPLTKYTTSEGLEITGMKANHDENVFPQHFLIEKDGKKFFYGCDGAWLLTSTYNFLKKDISTTKSI